MPAASLGSAWRPAEGCWKTRGRAWCAFSAGTSFCASSMPPVSSLKLANLCLLKDALTIEPANEGRRTSSKDGSRCKRYESNVTKSSAYEAGKRFRDIVGKRTSLP